MIDVELLKKALKPANNAELEYIQQLEAAAVAHVEKGTGRYYGPERTQTETVLGGGRSTLALQGPVLFDAYDVAQIVSVNEAAYPGGDPTEIETDQDDGFVLRDDVLHRKGGHYWLRGYEYEVVYLQGYAEGEEPADIRQAVMQLVTLWFTLRLPVALAGGSDEVPHNVTRIIEQNRRMAV